MLMLTDIQLAERQKTHMRRHTFATHFMMDDGKFLSCKGFLVILIAMRRCVQFILN